MCGRFSLAIDIKEIKERFHIADMVDWELTIALSL